MSHPTRKMIAFSIGLALSVAAVCAQEQADSLKSGFENPPQAAHPQVWWHWMNGNITKDGIKLDLEWMHRVGIGGFHNFDAALQTPQVVDHRLAYMTPEWKDAFKYATTLADQLGMAEGIAGSPGWSESGGPWVPAKNGQKKYVWSETVLEGGKPFTGKLAHPPTVTGAFQDVGIHDVLGSPDDKKPPEFYGDSAVVAFKAAQTDVTIESLRPKMTASGGEPDYAMLTDGDLVKGTKLPKPKQGESSWIQYAFDTPQTVRAVTVSMNMPGGIAAMFSGGAPLRTLEVSDDGQSFHEVAKLGGGPVGFGGEAAEHTYSFAPVSSRYFRVVFKPGPPPPLPDWAADFDASSMGFAMPKPDPDYDITELVLHPGARVNRWQEKAAFVPEADLSGFATPEGTEADAIAKGDVIDLTGKMKEDGTLDWTPPAGTWIVLRIGFSLQGITNHPATAEATGLEVDKLNGAAVKDYFEKYLDSYKETVGPEWMGKKGITFVINDSWEAGSQNWTDDMIAKFKTLRGYDPTPWLPVLTGRVVGSAADSDRFLWDLRKTISDLIANEHYGTLEAVLHEHNMIHYGESHESGRAFVADGMEVKKFNEVPMSAMWTQTPGVNKEQFGYNADDRESASVAHIYGRSFVAAESMTAAAAPWGWSPSTLKPTADQEFLNGINRIVVHESAHQPLIDKAPGLTLGPFGQWFNRNETWAEEAGAWVSYLARTSYLLQQGKFGADIIYFYGEDSNLTAIFAEKAPDIPEGYGFDYINADGLIHELKVSDGRVTTASGMSYRVLGLDPYSQHMSLPVLKAIHKLVEEGAVVSGPKPIDDPSLSDDQAEFRKLNDELFGDGSGVHKVGKGSVYAGGKLADVLTSMQVPLDFAYTKPEAETRLRFVHRKLSNGDLYFVDNRSDHAASVDATFRVAGKEPELWRAENGTTHAVSYKIADGRTTVPLQLEPWGTTFVVFLKPTSKTEKTVPTAEPKEVGSVNGPWTVAFQPNRGAPASIQLDKLASWTDNSDAGVKYFSGTGTYTSTFEATPELLKKGQHIWIDLGNVQHTADVSVNGKPLGILWHAPYKVDVTSALKQGTNELSIKVTNPWVNRLIGDQQPGATKITFTTSNPYKAKSKLIPSGLIGPVRLLSVGE
ncbi:MAG: glycosyl hydrolase [Terracidiphilus sp.]